MFLTGRDCAARGITTEIETAPATRAEAQVVSPPWAIAPLERRLNRARSRWPAHEREERGYDPAIGCFSTNR